jgi:hypothetical protein
MIGIVILGLGLVMVATIFPVAWTRARVLNEFTVERAAVAAAHETIRSVTRVSTPSLRGSSFLGDLTYDPTDPTGARRVEACDFKPCFPLAPADPPPDWVHPLNMENVRWGAAGQPKQFVPEDPWLLEDPPPKRLSEFKLNLAGSPIVDRSFYSIQLALPQRLYPTMTPRPDVDAGSGAFLYSGPNAAEAKRWDGNLDWHRYVWAVLHRLQRPMSSDADAVNDTRTFDIYYVLLRRAQPTFRFAVQDPTTAPNPCDITVSPPAPQALGPERDLMFPVAWRVNVEFPATLIARGPGGVNATGIPTEIQVPPDGVSGDTASKVMWLQMFQPGAQFIDEISGAIFRVAKRRLNAAGDGAFLTLDREVVIEDVDLPLGDADPRCCDMCNPGVADGPELVRTVWVFPPPVDIRAGAGDPIVFAGNQPVVSIDVRTLAIGPTH